MSDTGDVKEEFPYQIDEFYLDLQSDGSSIAILDQAAIVKMPFPGLRPFKTSEFQLFKGRSDQADELIKRLQRNKVLAVIGSSGTGKSSLVRAGLIPQLLGGYLYEAGTKWNIAICRPGKNPVENLAIALSSVKSKSKDRSKIIRDFKIIEPLLSQSVYGILDVNEFLNSDKADDDKHNLLIIVDQFEELFRFQRKDLHQDDIENHFVNLLLKAALNPGGSVYVVITMRSEFLGDCVKFRGLPEAINEGQYLVPQLSRNQLKEAIQGPIRLANKKIEPGLVELLINEIDENKLKENLDQLPILQHALMRSYNQAMLEGDEAEISHEHYERIGTMKKALANHAEAKYAELGNNDDQTGSPSKKQKIAKVIFQALTDTSADQKGGRRPIELSAIYAVSAFLGASEQEVDEVINHFRETETSFIMPPVNTALHSSLVLDISHESLMRNWDRLNEWMNEEARNGRLYKMLNERRVLNEQGGGKDQFIRGALLTEMLSWKELGQNAAWASRYHTKSDLNNNETDESIYKKNLDFLCASNEEATRIKNLEKNELLNKIKLAKKERLRITKIFSIALVVSAVFLIWALINATKAKNAATEAKLDLEVANQEGNNADLLNFDTKLALRKWWNDPYLTDDERKKIRDSLVNWGFTHRDRKNLILAWRLDYSLRILHEAEKLNPHDTLYRRLINYADQYTGSFTKDDTLSRSNTCSPDATQLNISGSSLNNISLLYVREKIGMDYFNEDDYDDAILLFDEIRLEHPTYSGIYNIIGLSLYSSKKYSKAVSNFQKAVQLYPSKTHLSNLAETYIAMHDTVGADSILKKALEVYPEDPIILRLLGQSLYSQGQWWEAKGSSLYAMRKYKQALNEFTKAFVTNNASSITCEWLARTYRKLNNRDTVKYLNLLRNAACGGYDDWFVLADYYDNGEVSDINKAIVWYKKYLEKGGRTFWIPYNNIAVDLCRQKNPDYDEAIKYADSAIALTGTQFMLTRKQIDLSEEILLKSGTQFVPDPANPYAHKAYAYLLKSQAQKQDSIKYKYRALALVNIKSALNRDPNYPKTHFYLACYYAVNGKTKEAIDALGKAIKNGFDGKSWAQSETMLNSINSKTGYRNWIDTLKKNPYAN